MNINEEEIKNPKPKYSLELQRYQKVHVPGNGNCLFSSLDMLVFDGSFGSYALRQLIADHINDNKDVYKTTIFQNSKNFKTFVSWSSSLISKKRNFDSVTANSLVY